MAIIFVEPRRLQQAIELFDRAITLPSNDQEQWLEHETSGDKELTGYVLRMLANDERAQQSIRTAAGFQLSDTSQDWVGKHFGPYRITKLLGEGGMSFVYLAERTDGAYEGTVALKLIKNPTASADIKRRFEFERQVLADLRHPNIATLLDAGSTQGLEYVVLEYIDGEQFYDYQRSLGIDDTLRLFRDVCSAVEHAHQSLIVHRDIKPGNILVDNSGIPKLLDFGIAKDLALKTDQATTWALTPAYASPEQVSGKTITLATDIYSLGVLLYEALADSRPHDVTNLSPGEAITELLETEPLAPSHRSSRLHELTRHAQEDLDAIVMRAMAKDPQRRYRTVSALMDDLDAYAQGMPVAAHAGSRGYVIRKFVKRNKVAVAATLLTTMFLVGALVIALTQVQLASEQLARSEAVSRYLQDILTSPDPTWNLSIRGGPGTTVAETLESAEAQLDNDLLDQPLVRIELYEAMGSAQMWLDNKDAALSTRRKALDLRRLTFADDPIQEAIGLMRLAEVHDDWRESDISLPMYLQAIDKYEMSGAEPNEFLTLLYNDTAIALFNNQHYERSLTYQNKALELSRSAKVFPNRTNEAAYLINNGRALLEAGQLDEAIKQLQQAQERFADDASVASFYLNRLFHTLGIAAISTQEFPKAAGYFDMAVQRTRQDNHAETKALALRSECWKIYAQLRAGGALRAEGQENLQVLDTAAQQLGALYESVTWSYHFVQGVDADLSGNDDQARDEFSQAMQLIQDPYLRTTGSERGILNRYLAEYGLLNTG